ncbi:hypothetical protein MMC13_001777 [Lambiella insularis]|nr:hypothetical protein [Lambiella insularis]
MFNSLSLVLVVALAAVAQANSYNHGRFHHRRQANGTMSGGDAMVTSTVYTTLEITVPGCAPTVVSCPVSESTHASVTTVTVDVYTTICPLSYSLSPFSSPAVPIPASLTSLVSMVAATALPSFGTAPIGTAPVTATSTAAPFPNGSGTISLPVGTGGPSSANAAGSAYSLSTGVPGSAAAPAGATTSVVTGNSTLTYTLGAGASTTIVTTTIKFTSTETILSTIYGTSPAAPSGNGAGSPAPTLPAAATSLNAALGGAGTGVQASATGPCPAQQTVTVTAQFTVTVTAAAGAGAEVSSLPTAPSAVPQPVTPSAAPAFTSAQFVNGTASTTSRCASGTGFLTMPSGGARPTGYRRKRSSGPLFR